MRKILDGTRGLDAIANVPSFSEWFDTCRYIREETRRFDKASPTRKPNRIVELLSNTMDCPTVAVDVGQHMMWTAQSFQISPNQHLLHSGGHGAMGHALPAAIGSAYACGSRVGCICGNRSMQMNIQELQWVSRDRLPLTIAVLNNNELGLICQQQDDLFDSLYAGAAPSHGFSSCNFCEVARAYDIPAQRITADDLLAGKPLSKASDGPQLIEVLFSEMTMAYPKTHFGEPMHRQQPYIDSGLQEMLEAL